MKPFSSSRLVPVLALLGVATAQAGSPPAFFLKWGTPGSGNGQLGDPWGVEIDAAGDIYVVDRSNYRIQKFGPDGTFLGKWGTSGTGDGQFNLPAGIAIDGAGDIYVADSGNHRIQKFDATGTYVTQWGSSGSGDGQFSFPYDLAVDPSGNVLVADTGNDRIQVFTADGTYLMQWGVLGSGDGQFDNPYGIDVDDDANVYVVDTDNYRIQKFTTAGTFVAKWGVFGSGDGELDRAFGVEVDAHGDLYVADTFNNRVQKFTSDGTFLTMWGGVGSGDGQMLYPVRVVTSPQDDVYVTESSGRRVQRFVREEPWITSALDIPADQGLQVRVSWARSGWDQPGGPPVTITGYDLFRRIPESGGAGALAGERDGLLPRALPPGDWDWIATVPAGGDLSYHYVAPTLCDSTAGDVCWSVFLVRATTVDPLTSFDSAPDSAYSVDDLVPPTPGAPAVTLAEGSALGLELDWNASPAPDFFYFGVYRGATPDFAPASPQDFYAVTTEPTFLDENVSPGETWYYRVAAFDDVEGFSGFSDAATGEVSVGVAGPGTTGIALLQSSPNPFRPRTEIAFALPSAGPVTLRVYGVDGALVRRLVDGRLDAGRHAVVWDGRDRQGHEVAAGTYFYVLETERERLSRKMVRLR